ncbi:MAG: hypothetical protein FWH41_06980 [Treponema sp.]|nr:hypothetical protein [Treponema sp.]
MKILKFGGSSVGSPEGIKNVIEIIQRSKEEIPVAVVSAFSGITDSLITMAQIASAGDTSYQNKLKDLYKRHKETAKHFIKDNEDRKKADKEILFLLDTLTHILEGIFLLGELLKTVKKPIKKFFFCWIH